MQPTAGLVEIEPSMAWNPSVVSGIGVVEDVDKLCNDMHAYRASGGRHSSASLRTSSFCFPAHKMAYHALSTYQAHHTWGAPRNDIA